MGLFYFVTMYCVYVIHSEKLKRFYTGTTDNFERRLQEHNDKTYSDSFTVRGIPWQKFLVIEGLTSSQARAIERNIKSMKSSSYIKNLKSYPEMIDKLKEKYSSEK